MAGRRAKNGIGKRTAVRSFRRSMITGGHNRAAAKAVYHMKTGEEKRGLCVARSTVSETDEIC